MEVSETADTLRASSGSRVRDGHHRVVRFFQAASGAL